MQVVISNEKKWCTVLTTISAKGDYILHHYIFKGLKPKIGYLALYESEGTYGLQKKLN